MRWKCIYAVINFFPFFNLISQSKSRPSERTPILDRSNPQLSSIQRPISLKDALHIPGVVEFSLCLFFSKLVSYTFLYWLPLYIQSSSMIFYTNDQSNPFFLILIFFYIWRRFRSHLISRFICSFRCWWNIRRYCSRFNFWFNRHVGNHMHCNVVPRCPCGKLFLLKWKI